MASVFGKPIERQKAYIDLPSRLYSNPCLHASADWQYLESEILNYN